MRLQLLRDLLALRRAAQQWPSSWCSSLASARAESPPLVLACQQQAAIADAASEAATGPCSSSGTSWVLLPPAAAALAAHHPHPHRSLCTSAQAASTMWSTHTQEHAHALRKPHRGLQARRAWAKHSDARDQVISSLVDLQQLEAYWATWGGDPGPCRLTHYNLARFLSRLVLVAGSYPADSDTAARVKHLAQQASAQLLRRGKLADPPCAAEALSALARLQQQHQLTPSPELIQLLLHVSTRRVEEAFVRDLRRTGQALQQLDVRGEVAGAWWAACWARVSALLPSGLVLPAHVGRLVAAGEALGHPAPDLVRRWWQAEQQVHQEQLKQAPALKLGAALAPSPA